MVNVGTAKICFSRIMRMVSSRELIGVIDGDHARPRGVQRAGLAGGVNGNVLAHARGFANGGGQLGFACIDKA